MSENPASTETGFSLTRTFTAFANATSRVTGRPLTFVTCIALILIWAATGPLFHYSDTWQLIINTSTTIITFLMVFLIQNTQNRDGAAIQAKLDELIRVTQAKNHFIGIERLTDKELEHILDEMEEHSEPMPMDQKSEVLNRKAAAVISKKGRTRAKPPSATAIAANTKPAAKTKSAAKPPAAKRATSRKAS
jgi:low affinity Fe/Cu permease